MYTELQDSTISVCVCVCVCVSFLVSPQQLILQLPAAKLLSSKAKNSVIQTRAYSNYCSLTKVN